MIAKNQYRTTFEVARAIEPIYTGGPVDLSHDGRLLATCLEEDVLLSDVITGERLCRIEGGDELITSLTLTPNGSHVIVCYRSLSMRIFLLDRSLQGSITSECTRTLKPHQAPVISIATDSTGTLVATGAADGIIRIWDIRGGYATHTLSGHSSLISALRFFNTKLIDENEDETGQSRKKKRKEAKSTISKSKGASGLRLASGDEDGKVRIWKLQTGDCISILDSHVSVVRAFDYNESEHFLLSGSRDKTVILWDTRTWKVKSTIPVLESVESSGFFFDDKAFYVAGEKGRIHVWWLTGKEATTDRLAIPDGQRIVQAISHSSLPFILSVHADQNLLLTSKVLKNVEPGSMFPSLPLLNWISGTHDEIIDFAFVGRNSSHLAVATNLEEIRILCLSESSAEGVDQNPVAQQAYFGADVGSLAGHEDIIICLDVDWSGHWLVTGAKDNTARLWRLDPTSKSYACYASFTGHAKSIGAIALPKVPPPKDSPAYREPLDHPPPFFITGSLDKTVKRWETKLIQHNTGEPTRASYTRKAHERDINAIDIDHEARLFASASQDATVKIWALEDGEATGILRGHKKGVWTVKFAPKNVPLIGGDGGNQASNAKGFALTGSGDRTVKIWSLSDYSCIRTFEGHTNSVLKVLWIVPPKEDSKSQADEDHVVTSGAAIPTKALVASAGADGLVKVWNARDGECEDTLDNHTERVWALTQNTENAWLVSGAGDGVITFWKDTTAITQAAAAKASVERVEEDQALQNYIREQNYREAITLALQLDHPARLLSLFKSVCDKFPPQRSSLSGDENVDEVLRSLGEEHFRLLVLRLRDWNTNPKTAPIAQKILWALLKTHPASKFSKLDQKLLRDLKVHTERHYRRLEDVIDESYIVEYTLRQMDELGGSNLTLDRATNGVNGSLVNGNDS